MNILLVYLVLLVAVLAMWRWAHRVPSDLDADYRAARDAMRQMYDSCDAWCPVCGGRCSQSPYHVCVDCDAQVCAREWL